MARECRSLLLFVLAEVETLKAVQAVQRCFDEDVQQCLDACPRSLRVRSRGRHVSQVNALRQTDGPRRVPQRSRGLDPIWVRTMMMILIMMMMMMMMMVMIIMR